MKFLSLLLLGLCACVVSVVVCEVSMQRESDADGNAGLRPGGGVVAGCECMFDRRGSSVVSSAYDVLEMSGVRGVGGVCEMCMNLARGWR